MKKPPADPKTCASCESFRTVPGESARCYLMPPVCIDGIWTRPPVESNDECRFWLRRLNS
jgi:hypothetical protein